MIHLLIFLAFALKHFIATNMVDKWYTDARDQHIRNWPVYIVLQSIFEGTLSLLAYHFLSYDNFIPLIAGEMAVLSLSALFERIPDYSRMIVYHIVSELSVIIFYWCLTYKVLES
jgi:hypothetical protein